MNDEMFEGLNSRARKIFSLAEEEARAHNHGHIGTEHILLGLIRSEESIATKALESLGISLDAVRQRVEEIIGQGRQAPGRQVPLTAQAVRVLNHSRREARQRNSVSRRQAAYVGTEHILLGLIREGNGVAARVLVPMGANLGRVSRQVIELREGRVSAWGGQLPPPPVHSAHRSEPVRPAILVLDACGQNLTRLANQGRLDPVIGRETEIRQAIQVLSQAVRHLPVLVGGSAASRSSVVRGVAQRIAAGEVPEAVKNKQLYVLDPGALVTGGHTGDDLRNLIQELTVQFEDLQRRDKEISVLQLLLAVLEESRAKNDIILFVDELAKEAESADQVSRAISVMASVLASGQLQLIGGATVEEYRKSWAEAMSLAPQIQPVQVSDPANSYSIGMLKIALRSVAQTKVLEDY